MQDTCSSKVVLFKSLAQNTDDVCDDSYIKKLNEFHINATLYPTLQYVYKNLDNLTNALSAPDIFSGIIFLSPRCVQAVINCLPYLDGSVLNSKWSSLSVFVIGEATAREVSNVLKLEHKGSSSGSFKNLIDIIIEDTYEKPLLMPCGNLHKTSDEDILKSRNIVVEHIEVYDTCQLEDMKEKVNAIFSLECLPRMFVFFSPSGVSAVLPHIPYSYRHLISYIALGQKTKSALIDQGIEQVKTCDKPTEDSLLQAVMSVLRDI